MKGQKIFDAIEFAVKAHTGKFRKGTSVRHGNWMGGAE
jgi:hypothetical protein